LAYTTIMTIMSRLVEKGWLTAEKRGRAYLYRATHSRQEAEAEAAGKVIRALLEDFGDVAVAQFVRELDEIDPKQLTRLAELAQRAERDEDRQE
jgi:BlaI family transcriptional regulator, penicillinase repressor